MEEVEERKVYIFILEAGKCYIFWILEEESIGGVKLGCEDETAATAAVLTHRFFRKLPAQLGSVCPYSLATAALYLAGKIQEDFIKIRDAVNVAYASLHPGEGEGLDVGELYWDLRDGIGSLELLLSRTLAFHLTFTHPHRFLSQYLDSLRSWLNREDWDSANIASTSLALLRDSYVRPELPLSVEPQLFALACVGIALDVYGIRVPLPTEADSLPWPRLFYPSADLADLARLKTKIYTTLTPAPS